MNYFLITLIFYSLYLFVKLRKSIHMLQQNFYDSNLKYLKWIIKNIYKVFINLDIISLFIPLMVLYSNNNMIYILVGLLFFILFMHNKKIQKKEQTKKPLVYTKRVQRLIITFSIITGLMIFLMAFNFNKDYLHIYYLILVLYSYFVYFITWLVNIINIPVEKWVYFHFYNKAVSKRDSMKDLKVVGITGSYGKTSTKNAVSTILDEKYRVLPSPHSYNTPYGLMRTINENLTKFDEVLVAEMGAIGNHQIKRLTKIVKPNYAIISRIGIAHLETFKTEENILNTKFELVESLDENGVAVLNKDDPKQVLYNIKSKCKVVWIGIDNKADVNAINIKYDHKGSSFDVVFKGDKNKYHFKTNLLGYANIYNILSGLALAREMGLSISQMQNGVSKIKQFEHRLELKNYTPGTYIIDDSFNSNPIGSSMALDVLKIMPGKRIVVTPGMIELADQEYQKNYEFGYKMASSADVCILVGEKQTIPIYEGLVKASFDKKNIYVINDVKEAFPLINRLKEKETYVLLENDLPDLFNEK